VEVGRRVRHFKVGDLVTRVGAPAAPGGEYAVYWGGFAEYGIARDHRAMKDDGLPREQWSAFRVNQVLPADLDPAAATMVITWRETLSYLTRMGVARGSRVLILGSGGNGLAFAAHAANAGAALVVMVGNRNREEVARKLGVSDYFDYNSPEWPRACGAGAQCQGGYDFVIDAVGKKGMMTLALPTLKAGGTIGIYGIDDYDACALNPRKSRGTFTCYNGGYDEEETHDRVVALVQSGRLRAEMWLDLAYPFPLERIRDAFDAVRRRAVVKALVKL
jgi:threonine dehydrogenase-like Zn-dependent dehydrogenase